VKTRRSFFVLLVIAALFLSAFVPLAAQRFDWVIIKKLTVLEGGAIFNSDVTVDGTLTATDFSAGDDLTVTDDLAVGGDLDVDGATTLNSTLDVDGNISSGTGAITMTDAVNIGVDGTSYDVTFYSDTEGDYFLWDQANVALTLIGTNGQDALNVDDGNVDIADDLDVDGTTNLDDVDIDLSASLNIDGHMLDVGTGSYTHADGDNDLGVAGDAEIDGGIYGDGALDIAGNSQMTGTLNVDGAVTFNSTLDVDGNISSGTGAITITDGVVVDGGLVDVGVGSYVNADGDDDLGVAGDAEVDGGIYGDDLLDIAGNTQMTGTLNVDDAVTLNSTLDVDGAVTLNGTLDVDGNLSSGTGVLTITDGVLVDGGLTDVGGGSYGTADGDNDLGIAGDVEVEGTTQLDGVLDANSTSDFGGNVTVSSGNLAVSAGSVSVTGGDVTLNAATGNGNGAVQNEYIGLPRIKLVGGAQGTNPGSQTIDLIDDSPTGEFEPVDSDVTEAEGSVAGVFKVDSSSYEATFADTAAEDDGFIDADLGSDAAWDDMESVGMWLYITSASTDTLQGGDLQLVLTDDGGDRKFDIPAVSTPETWTWVEVNIATGDLSSISDVAITLTANGETNMGAFTLYLDEMWVWDAVDEEALSTAILDGGVLSVVDTEGGATLAEWTDYIVHYESGNDFIVYVTDQSAADVVALLAY
jgi:cytoskeletal protein CcmA (bactofilin family)